VPLVAAPIVVIRGARDPLVSRRWAMSLAAAVPQGRFVEVRGAAHATYHGRPRLVAQLLLKEIDASRATATAP
jgi:pimeloyl-ACP methyl ester carboxylesterase